MRTTSKQRTWLATLLLAAPLLTSARKTKTVAATDVPVLTELLEAAGWTMTPERSSTYTVGDIYSRRTNSPIAFKDDCFDGEAREGAYTSLEVVQTMKAGGKVPLGMARITAKGMEYKQVTFAEPYITELAAMHLTPLPACRQMLLQQRDIEDLFVIQSVLSAEVKEQLCRTIEAGARGIGFQADASGQQDCKQASEGHVAVAYKIQSVAPLLTGTQGTGSQGTQQANFDGVGSSLDINERLRQKRCDDEAKLKGQAIRDEKLKELEADAQAKARSAWKRVLGSVEGCTELQRTERDRCIALIEEWLVQGFSMHIKVPPGQESVRTSCGTKMPAFGVTATTITATGVDKAQALLHQMQAQGAVKAGSMTRNTIGMEMVRVEPGHLVKRCLRTNPNWKANACKYLYSTVTVDHPYLIQSTEVTQMQWQTVLGKVPRQYWGSTRKPAERCGLNCPATNINWAEAIRFMNVLSANEGLEPVYAYDHDESIWITNTSANGYRFPTQDEWEYAARTGLPKEADSDLYSGSNNAHDVAWIASNSRKRYQEVAQKAPNAWGLFDMTGNVAEWCSDEATGDLSIWQSALSEEQVRSGGGHMAHNEGLAARLVFRREVKATDTRLVIRGGSWASSPTESAIHFPRAALSYMGYPTVGLRVVRTVD
jgi:formylglycine-generating enzyme required for sulfatase activity